MGYKPSSQDQGSWVINDSRAGSLSAGTKHMSTNTHIWTRNVKHVRVLQKQTEKKNKVHDRAVDM